MDAAGNAVALTMTINTPFGSGITVPGTGVVLNNEMDDFSVARDTPNTYGLVDTRGANAIAPGKRPLSSMTPTLVEKDGRLFMVTGSPGGPRIISTTLLTVLHVIDFGMDVQQAVAAPRISFIEPDILAVERRLADSTRQALAAMGHHVQAYSRLGNAHGLTIEYDADGRPIRFTGAADPRGEGVAQGL